MRVKKRTKKTTKHSDGRLSVRSSELSGSNLSNYTYVTEPEYEDNREGDPIKMNGGFDIQPLDPHIYGKEIAEKAKRFS